MGNSNDLGMSALNALSLSLGPSIQMDEDFSDIDDHIFEKENVDELAKSDVSEEQASSEIASHNDNVEDAANNLNDSDVASESTLTEANTEANTEAGLLENVKSDVADTENDEHAQSKNDDNAEFNLEEQEQIIKAILATTADITKDKTEEDKTDKNDEKSSKNDNLEPPKKSIQSNLPPVLGPSLFVTNDDEMEVSGSSYSASKGSGESEKASGEPKLKVEQDNPVFPKELLSNSYKLKVVSQFRFGLKSVEINANDLSMDLHLKNGTLIKDFGKDFLASGSSPEDLAVAAVKMAKCKGWKFIKATGEPEYIAALEKECRKANLGIRHADAARLQSAVERFRRPDSEPKKSQEHTSTKNANASPAKAKAEPVSPSLKKEIDEASEDIFEPQIGKF